MPSQKCKGCLDFWPSPEIRLQHVLGDTQLCLKGWMGTELTTSRSWSTSTSPAAQQQFLQEFLGWCHSAFVPVSSPAAQPCSEQPLRSIPSPGDGKDEFRACPEQLYFLSSASFLNGITHFLSRKTHYRRCFSEFSWGYYLLTDKGYKAPVELPLPCGLFSCATAWDRKNKAWLFDTPFYPFVFKTKKSFATSIKAWGRHRQPLHRTKGKQLWETSSKELALMAGISIII